MKIFENENETQKFYFGGFLSGGGLSWVFCLGFMSGGFLSGGLLS